MTGGTLLETATTATATSLQVAIDLPPLGTVVVEAVPDPATNQGQPAHRSACGAVPGPASAHAAVGWFFPYFVLLTTLVFLAAGLGPFDPFG